MRFIDIIRMRIPIIMGIVHLRQQPETIRSYDSDQFNRVFRRTD